MNKLNSDPVNLDLNSYNELDDYNEYLFNQLTYLADAEYERLQSLTLREVISQYPMWGFDVRLYDLCLTFAKEKQTIDNYNSLADMYADRIY
jgi:hypothetical protein